MTNEEFIKAIDSITDTLKGPLTNLERALLVTERKELREILDERLQQQIADAREDKYLAEKGLSK